MGKAVVTVDGANFSTLEGFFDEFERRVLKGKAWGRNLDAFNDVLRGGSGTPLDSHNEIDTRRDIAAAASCQGSTVFDWLLDIIRAHGLGGDEAEDGIELLLR